MTEGAASEDGTHVCDATNGERMVSWVGSTASRRAEHGVHGPTQKRDADGRDGCACAMVESGSVNGGVCRPGEN